jgi:hypothetical protein
LTFLGAILSIGPIRDRRFLVPTGSAIGGHGNLQRVHQRPTTLGGW